MVEQGRESGPTERPGREPRGTQPLAGGSGLEANVAGALSYLLGPVTGVLFLLLDKDEPFVRFHAVQCLVVSVAWVVAWMAVMFMATILGVVPVLGWLLGTLISMALSLAGLVLWVYLMFRAFQGDEWEVPLLGEYARRFEHRV